MIQNLLRFLKKNKTLQNKPEDSFVNLSFSQEGEDLILLRYFEKQPTGFYVDIGAHHPFRFSNTYLFYQKGWNGINVDANPGSKNIFDNYRPNDINIEVGISIKEDNLEYYSFKEAALNTFSSKIAQTYISDGWEIKEKITIKTISLLNLFQKELKPKQSIDFLTMDIEGLEIEALKSNDWTKYRPKVLLIEILDFDLTEYQNSPICCFLNEKGYKIMAKTKNTVFFYDIIQN